MRILVVQIARMGDTLQTSPLLSALRAAHPDAHITLLVRRMGLTVAERHPAVDETVVYHEDDMFKQLRSGDSDSLLEAYTAAEGYLRRLREGRYDIAYNCTHSFASAVLLKIAGIPRVVGAHLGDEGHFVLRGAWTNYFFTSVMHREFNTLNLCDIWRHFAGAAGADTRLRFTITDEDRAAARDILARHGIGPGERLLCIQLGASDESKRWPPERFAAFAARIAEAHDVRVVLVGVPSEAELGQAFSAQAPGLAVPLYGETNLPQLAALLERATLLATNDTGTMHVAAAAGCPVLLVSVGWVHFRETGPYGAGHVAIERRRTALAVQDEVAKEDVGRGLEPGPVIAAADWMLTDPARRPATLPQTPAMDGVDVYRAAFAPDGCLEWYPLLRRPLAERDALRMLYRAMWLAVLRDEQDAGTRRAALGEMLRHFETNRNAWQRAFLADASGDESAEDAGQLGNRFHRRFPGVVAELRDKAAEGERVTAELLDQLRQRAFTAARETVARLMRIDEEARILGEVHEAVKPMVLITRFERDNLEGADPEHLARETGRIYRDLGRRARIMLAVMEDFRRVLAETGEQAPA